MKGRRNTLFGYQIINGRITVFEDEAHTVRRIFEMYANGYSLGLIAKTLTAEHIKYYDMETRWDKARVLRILVNEKYIGIDSYPMIVTKEEFNSVAKIKATRSPKVTSSPCSGGKETVLCEVCGSKMIVRTPHNRKALQCKNCGIYIYLSSKEISDRLQNIYEFVASNPYLLLPRERPQVMAMNPNIQLYELKRLLAQTNVDQDEVLHLISDIAKIEYSASDVGSDILARRLRNRIERASCDGKVSVEFIQEYIDRVCVDKRGNIILYMTTGVQISERSVIDGSHKNPEKNGEPD